MQTVVWRLCGSTDQVVECRVEKTTSTARALTVVFGPETFLYETYPDEASALGRAMQVREGLLKSGGWTLAAESMGVMDTPKSRIQGAR